LPVIGLLAVAVLAHSGHVLAGLMGIYVTLRPPRMHHGRRLFGLAMVLAAASAYQGFGTITVLLAASMLWAGCGLTFMNASLRYRAVTERSTSAIGALLSVVFTGIPTGALFVLLGQQAAVRWMVVLGAVLVAAGVLVTEHVHRTTTDARSSIPDTDRDADGPANPADEEEEDGG